MSIVAQNRITKEKQRLFINTTEIPGIQSLTTDYTNNATLIKYLGMPRSSFEPNGPYVANFSVNSFLISNNQFIQYTGSQGFNGYILKNVNSNSTTNLVSFTSGYLVSYSTQCGIGEIPQISMTATILNNWGDLTSSESDDVLSHLNTIKSSDSTLKLKTPTYGCIDFNLEDYTNNRVQSYNITINVNRNPSYKIGSKYPYSVDINYPIEIVAAVVFEASDNYTFKKLTNFPLNAKYNNFQLNIKDYKTDEIFDSYSFNEMLLTSEAYNSDVDGNLAVTQTYKKYITR